MRQLQTKVGKNQTTICPNTANSLPELTQSDKHTVLQSLFGTVSFYQDRESRLAVQRCLISLIRSENETETEILRSIVQTLQKEAQKQAVATSTAFVWVEWCSILMQHLAGTARWELFGKDILALDAQALDKCLQHPLKHGIARSALVVTRRAFRKLFSTADVGKKALEDAVAALTSKQTHPTAKNGLILGVIAGVCARSSVMKDPFLTLKLNYYDFYAREIIGSRVAIPPHIAGGLNDFFEIFLTHEELKSQIMPNVEKGLLRSPEVILTGVLKPLLSSLPQKLDISDTLEKSLLKSILSNLKSSNAAIRDASVAAFSVAIAHSRDQAIVNRIVQEISGPLKAGKVASADHRILHSSMLESIPLSTETAETLATSLAAVASKEGNEAALSAELRALGRAVGFILRNNELIPAAVHDTLAKGLADKKAPVRKLWMLSAGHILWNNISSSSVNNSKSFVETIASKLVATLEEVATNPATAAQSGLIIGAYVLMALHSKLEEQYAESKLPQLFSKADITNRALSTTEKQPILLSSRIYNKATTEDDLIWLLRALAATSNHITSDSSETASSAWAEAMIHLISTHAIHPAVQRAASQNLSQLYSQRPGIISEFIIAGLWAALRELCSKEKDSTHERTAFTKVLRSISLDPSELPQKDNNEIQVQLEEQACSLVVLARPELIPTSNWIDTVIRMGVDPGDLARKHRDSLLGEIGTRTAPEQVSSTYYIENYLCIIANSKMISVLNLSMPHTMPRLNCHLLLQTWLSPDSWNWLGRI